MIYLTDETEDFIKWIVFENYITCDKGFKKGMFFKSTRHRSGNHTRRVQYFTLDELIDKYYDLKHNEISADQLTLT